MKSSLCVLILYIHFINIYFRQNYIVVLTEIYINKVNISKFMFTIRHNFHKYPTPKIVNNYTLDKLSEKSWIN